MEFKTLLDECVAGVERELDRVLPRPDDSPESRLYEAMRYATLGGGKRLRAFLVLASSRLFDVADEPAYRVAAAIECLHAYSLVHDDLPCMDDDDLRRGQPTVHKKYDEATAVLVGDALLTIAFELLADPAAIPNSQARAELVLRLARAAGARGMVGGQVLDINAADLQLSEQETVRLQRMKTGELIAFSAEAGAVLGRAGRNEIHHLAMFAHDLGLAFQITDDLLDVTGTAEEMGKAVNKDGAAGKATFVDLLGVETARDRAEMLAQQAARHLDLFGEKAQALKGLCQFVLTRKN